MTMKHLLAISVGPVQEFIAAARRTRDLWFGSYLLSEISRAVAKSVEAKGGKLIFPASSNASNVANVILAELPDGEPKDVAAEARKAAQERWLEFANEARNEADGVIRDDIWNDQVDDVIEFYAAWVDYPDDKTYADSRRRVMRLLAGRKACRDFLPAKGRAGVPKSSLDGLRESVLKHPDQWPARYRAKLRVKRGEQLDVVGLVKRIAGGSRPYPSVSRIAADPWVRGNQGSDALEEVAAACKALGKEVVHQLDIHKFPQFEVFPFEGTAVFPSRHHEWLEETDLATSGLVPLRNALKKLPEVNPYLAVLVADGDRMGEAISRLKTPGENRTFSTTLAGFADEANNIIREHNGVLVYAGGDDVLAFVPVDLALQCARALHDDFGARLKHYKSAAGEPPTLSVGLAIGHFMENLETLLNYGRGAEKDAKTPDRNGLAVHLYKRGGSPIRVRGRWDSDPDEKLQRLATMLNEGIVPAGLPYELRELARNYQSWPQDTQEQRTRVGRAMRADVLRVCKRKKSTTGSVVTALQPVLDELSLPSDLLELAHRLLVARQIAAANKQAARNKTSQKEVA
ncbi:MAG: type III-B CRISPR-associated protein Cas10/Cmr2 [Gemmatales bacterium]|nr:MAG: type III-B CRISPR-associated protein Cas10/Cmr2 [Gemmatales bacterium]